MRRNRVLRARVGALLAAALCTQTGWAQVGAPLLGYLPEAGHILPVNGIAAAASVGPALNFGGDFLQIAVSPRHDFALASEAGTGAVVIAYPSATTTAISGLSASPSSITLSPAGSSAVLWFDSTQTVQIVSGLPAAPTVRAVSAGFLAEAPAALAVSDDGAWAAGAWPGGVWAFGPNGEVNSIFSSDRVFAMTFFAGQENLAVATGSGVYSIADVGGSAAVSTVFQAQAIAPTGLAVSSDNTTLVLTGRHGAIVSLNPATGASSRVDCGCTAEGAFPMGGSIYRITGVTGSVFRVFDISTSSVFQIPLAAGTQGKPVVTDPTEALPGGSR